jgi:hypothetical protein
MNENESSSLKSFFVGMVLVIVVQTIFMLGGYLVEKQIGLPVTGIPSSIGLTLVLVLGVFLVRRLSEYVLLGSFTLAFISPLILFLVVFFRAVPFNGFRVHFSLVYMVLLICGVWAYFLNKIIRGRM